MNKMVLIVAVAAAGCTGCFRRQAPDPALFIKPTIAVMTFENRAPFPLNWNLGDGMADVLTARLVASNRFEVIARRDLAAVLREQGLQASGATRGEARVATGRIKNVRYLVNGTVTDFNHVSKSGGFVGGKDVGVLGGSAKAVMGMTFSVVDVESGKIVYSDRIEEEVSTSNISVQATYKDTGLGGKSFSRTPLGRATSSVMDRAVAGITAKIASVRWQPTVSQLLDDGRVVLEGGKDRRIRVGYMYELLEQGSRIVSHNTGDVIGRLQPTVIARVKVTEVNDRFCLAEMVQGDALQVKAGLSCRPYGKREATGSSDSSQRRKTSSPPYRRH